MLPASKTSWAIMTQSIEPSSNRKRETEHRSRRSQTQMNAHTHNPRLLGSVTCLLSGILLIIELSSNSYRPIEAQSITTATSEGFKQPNWISGQSVISEDDDRSAHISKSIGRLSVSANTIEKVSDTNDNNTTHKNVTNENNPTTPTNVSGTSTETDPNKRRNFLVRELSDLIMNTERKDIISAAKSHFPRPEANGQTLGGLIAQDLTSGGDEIGSSEELSHNGEESSEERPLEVRYLFLNDEAFDDNSNMGEQSDDTNNYKDLPMGEQQQQLEQQYSAEAAANNYSATDDLGQAITCSPDYEDAALIEASGNMTTEQQQQLLNGVDSAGLLANNSNGEHSIGSNQLRPAHHCVQPGNRMIEIITKIITPILFTIIIVVGLVGNIIVMLVILEDRKTDRELTPTNLLILDLSLADLSFIIFCIPFTGWDYAVGHWVFGPLWCKFNQYLIVVCALSSIYTLVLMSIDRFLAIVHPIECMSYRTSKNMLYAICIKWILILLIASPTIPMHGLIDSPLGLDQYNCRFLTEQYNPLHFQIVFFITSYLFPLILIFCLYLSVLNKLWFGAKPHGHRESSKMTESKKKVTWLVAGIVVVFALCWCPIQVMLILMRLKSHRITATYVAIQVFSHILGYMNSCVNPIVYAFASETFTNSFKRSSLGRLCYMCFGVPKNHGNSHNNYHFKHSTASHHNLHNNQSQLNTAGQTTDPERSTVFRTYPSTATSTPLTLNHRPSLNHFIEHDETGTNINSLEDNRQPFKSTATALIVSHAECERENAHSMGKIVSLPLEPRDRIVLPAQSVAMVQQTIANSNGLSKSGLDSSTRGSADDNKVPMQNSHGGVVNRIVSNGAKASSPTNTTPTTTTTTMSSHQTTQQSIKMPAKQQLVARIDKSSNQISHECENGEQLQN